MKYYLDARYGWIPEIDLWACPNKNCDGLIDSGWSKFPHRKSEIIWIGLTNDSFKYKKLKEVL